MKYQSHLSSTSTSILERTQLFFTLVRVGLYLESCVKLRFILCQAHHRCNAFIKRRNSATDGLRLPPMLFSTAIVSCLSASVRTISTRLMASPGWSFGIATPKNQSYAHCDFDGINAQAIGNTFSFWSLPSNVYRDRFSEFVPSVSSPDTNSGNMSNFLRWLSVVNATASISSPVSVWINSFRPFRPLA